ncbi:hypothetical protein ACF1DW_19650 [Streptomyces sp. NPDC014603]|uniref:hypothetical protein n=1 Tax=Streptomyces sp. NPDC014603 TaxID=3364873 RepID=UPI0036F65180
MSSMSRRSATKRMLGLAGAGAFLACGGTALLATPATAADGGRPRKGPEALRKEQARIHSGTTSVNGWEMQRSVNSGGHIWTRPVPGTGMRIDVRIGAVERVLVHLVQRFHYEICALGPGDVTGWCAPGTVRKGLPESNRASGTAVTILPGHYPPGASGGFLPLETAVVRDVLAELEGTVRWGGDDPKPDESLFSLDVPPGDARLEKVAARLKDWRTTPGAGPGTTVDIRSSGRRAKAGQLRARQTA